MRVEQNLCTIGKQHTPLLTCSLTTKHWVRDKVIPFDPPSHPRIFLHLSFFFFFLFSSEESRKQRALIAMMAILGLLLFSNHHAIHSSSRSSISVRTPARVSVASRGQICSQGNKGNVIEFICLGPTDFRMSFEVQVQCPWLRIIFPSPPPTGVLPSLLPLSLVPPLLPPPP